jgi:dephospho-CoA kinase
MKIIGITGGIGCGKSEVCRYLKRKYGAQIIMADDVAHEVTQPGTKCCERLKELFGDGYFLEDGSLDRKKTGALVFKRPGLLKKMNGIIHPAVWDEINARLKAAQAAGKGLAVIEAALLVGSNYRQICSEFWYIYADRDVRIKRLIESRDITKEKALDVMKNQISEEEFRAGCDFTVDNSGDFEETARRIDERLLKGNDL